MQGDGIRGAGMRAMTGVTRASSSNERGRLV